mmetsp:Transcript_18911/g.32344  ORF Transcript_18911/g.32344 Transcript_18911/m.32344 type:complete len:326 (+) Transcript_18911:446-1423(+)
MPVARVILVQVLKCEELCREQQQLAAQLIPQHPVHRRLQLFTGTLSATDIPLHHLCCLGWWISCSTQLRLRFSCVVRGKLPGCILVIHQPGDAKRLLAQLKATGGLLELQIGSGDGDRALVGCACSPCEAGLAGPTGQLLQRLEQQGAEGAHFLGKRRMRFEHVWRGAAWRTDTACLATVTLVRASGWHRAARHVVGICFTLALVCPLLTHGVEVHTVTVHFLLLIRVEVLVLIVIHIGRQTLQLHCQALEQFQYSCLQHVVACSWNSRSDLTRYCFSTWLAGWLAPAGHLLLLAWITGTWELSRVQPCPKVALYAVLGQQALQL